ncbi:pullulanase X25 domain-containing protein [Bacillus sp. USDA818B3_A]|uniref:pullulanase X25 domain-containing protein n=1 Tax=Bacillus sp. USDA818B3_A TaxID=2698834 RepID=UPI00136B725C|nr:alpha-amylase family glycosyl hydrolase [Bacillus sp. USDA818B3_A]
MKKTQRTLLSLVTITGLILQLLTSFSSGTTVKAAETASKQVVLVGNLQTALGNSGDWDPSSTVTKMADQGNGLYTFTGTLSEGTYEYKIAIGGSWDENYGEGGTPGGNNIKLTLSEQKDVTFYYNDNTHSIADSTHYTPLTGDRQPRIAGTIQPAIQAGPEWSPAESTALLTDEHLNNVYSFSAKVPRGSYEYKIVLGKDWTESYPSSNVKLNVLSDTTITFFYNHQTKEVYTDYKPTGSDGLIDKSALYHDSWDKVYRTPFGAIPANEPVTLRVSAKKGDLTRSRLYVKNYNTGTSNVISMKNSGWADSSDKGPLEYWEATFTPADKGIYGYKFIVGDQDATAEYGEDTQEGHTGKAEDKNAGLFQLTVYDPSYKTPDWMKEAVVYQIFPDRFYNGNKANDTAKDQIGARGSQPIEHPETWVSLPDNPYEQDTGSYKGDGEFTNDFFGGDLAGIKAKLDYLQSLGVNTLYLNPISLAPSNHKYDATDYKQVDPMFGSQKEFEDFAKELSKRHMHLILDGVFNHVSDDSIYFDRYNKYKTVGAYEYWSRIYDLMNQEKLTETAAKEKARKQFIAEGQTFSPYGFENWFDIQNEKVDNEKVNGVSKGQHYKYDDWWGYDSLPVFKSVDGTKVDHPSELNNTQLSNYIFYNKDSVAKSWIDQGSSGWRLDVANEVDSSFWQEFRKQMKSKTLIGSGKTLQKGEEPLILGEIWDDASKYFLGDQYDSVMNYRFRGAILDYLKNGNAANAENTLLAVQEDYPKEAFYALMNLMGSHDTARAIFLLGNGTDTYYRAEQDPNYNYNEGVKRLKLASILQMGYPGAPTIYYGDEAGQTGSKDPDDRRTYPWGKEDKSLIAHYQKIGQIRKDNADLFAYGDLHHIYAKGDVLAYVRTKGTKSGLVIINRGKNAQTVEIDTKELLANGLQFVDQLDKKYEAVTKDGRLSLTVPAESGRMLLTVNEVKLPVPVKDVTGTAGSKQVTLSWTGNAAKYNVYQSTVSGGLWTKVKETTDTTVNLADLNNGRTYYFSVTAVDKNGNESVSSFTSGLVPHYDLTKAGIKDLTKLENGELNLAQASNVKAAFYLSGATETGAAEGVTAELQVRLKGQTDWQSSPALYNGQTQDGQANEFQGSFTAYEAGTYEYRLAFTPDLAKNWVYSETGEVTYTHSTSDTTPPAKEVVLDTPVKESGQVNLSWKLSDPDQPYKTVIYRDGQILTTLNGDVTSLKDYQVANGTAYKYRIRIFDQAGNYVDSNTVSVTPEIVMVQVTFKVHAPDYTPLSAQVNIPGSLNGWNTGAWSMSRNGAVTADWEYTMELEEGTELTYKYVKNNSWDQEGLTDHTPNDPSDDDISYYGYGAQGTDMKIVVTNQGNNKMLIQDTILRWIDLPLVVSQISVSGSTMTVIGNAIKGADFTINGEKVAVGNDMQFTHSFTLQTGQTSVPVHIEPSNEAKSTIFKGDGGSINKNTKNYSIDAATKTMTEIKN